MEHFLINSTACLFTLWLAYKLLLENTSWHSFKRFYLIGALIISLIIPFIVVETIVIPIEETPFVDYGNLIIEDAIVEESGFTIYWFYVFSGIYIIGIAIMLWRFGKNLNSFRIQQEDEISSYKAYQLILRNHLTIPHSFLKRIFISKKDHESNNIPKVILEHEKAHLDQKHSLDILFIELLLIVLWFNPLLYIIRYSIKLNHEFLADSAVLNQGISTVSYQEVLLKHATTSYQQAMANTFTFPIIKKRFNIMKTHTSNTSLVLRSLALIPILALLVISCGKEETEFIEVEETIIEVEEIPANQKLIIVDPNDPEGKITINGEPHYYKITEDKIDIYNEHGELQDFKSQGYKIIQTTLIEVGDTPELINEYNFQAKKHQKFIEEKGHVVVFKEDTKRMQLIFNSMSDQQKAENEPWPYLYWDNDITPGDIPPPPPPTDPKTVSKEEFTAYNEWAKKVNDQNKAAKQNGNNEYAIIKMKDLNNYKTIYDKMSASQKSDAQPLPKLPPPPPANPLDYIKDKGDKMNYYIDGEKVTAVKAKDFIKKNGNKGIQIGPVDGVYSLKMFTRLKNHDGYKINTNASTQDTTVWIKDLKKAGIVHSPEKSARLSKDYSARKTFLLSASRQQKPVKFEIDGNKASLQEVESLIKKYNDVPFSITTKNGNEHTFNYSTNNHVEMSKETLNNMYSLLFKTIDPDKNTKQFIISQPSE